MINSSHLFLILTVIMGGFGFSGPQGTIATVSQALFVMFFALMVTSLMLHEIQRREH
ncbi:MAG: DUF1328 domain-containing protein [Luteolibacter sp.]|uniref:DUF1328 domain-containing protein n=1 Tax=Luteolibacter sp. TaxID=1962973 RepID=UPI0032644D2D